MSGNEQRAVRSPRGEHAMTRTSSEFRPGTGDGVRTSGSRRRRRPANSNSQPKNKNQLFYFVDSSSSSKEKRAHVMRHHVQEKKKHRKLSHETIPVDILQEGASGLARPDSGYDANANANEPAMASGQASAIDQTSSLPIRFSTVRPYEQPTVPLQLGSPSARPEEPRRDPFSSPPVLYRPEDQELVDWWTTKLSYWSGQNHYVKNTIYRTAMEHPLPFQTIILTYSARWRAQMNETPDSIEVQQRVGQVRKQLDDCLARLIPINPHHLAAALAGMALQEQRFGSSDESRVYLEQALGIIQPRAGINASADVFVQYVRYIMPPLRTTLGSAGRDWLVTFLRGAEDLTRTHSSSEYLALAPQRCTAFQMGSPLFCLLSSGPRPTQVPPASRRYVVPGAHTLEVSRAAALVYITAVLWDFRDSPDKTVRFLTYLHGLVEQHQLDRELNCETLLWLLLEQGCDPDLRDSERAWSTGELLEMNKQLRPDLQFHFNEILMSFFTLQPPIRGIDVFEAEIEAEIQ